MRQKDTYALINAELALHHFKQTEQMSNSNFLEKLCELIEVYEHLDGKSQDHDLMHYLLTQVDQHP